MHLVAFGLLLVQGALAAAPQSLAVLPFRPRGVDPASAQTADLLLRQELGKAGAFTLIPESQIQSAVGGTPCSEAECAATAGKACAATRALAGSLNSLGDKVVVQFVLVDPQDGRVVLVDSATALGVGDLENVMRRIALSVARGEPIQRTAEVGAITQKEELEPGRRRAYLTYGLKIGYLFPVGGYTESDYVYTGYPTYTSREVTVKRDRILAMDFVSAYEMENTTATFTWGSRAGMALNVGLDWIPGRKDITGMLGGALGFHWVTHDEYGYLGSNDKKHGDGFEMILRTGIMFFRTYNFRMLVSLDYSYVFNDYQDQGVALTIGILTHRKEGSSGCLGLF